MLCVSYLFNLKKLKYLTFSQIVYNLDEWLWSTLVENFSICICLTKRQYRYFLFKRTYNMSLPYDENMRNILNHLEKQETREKKEV